MANASRLRDRCPSLLSPYNHHAQLLQTWFNSINTYRDGINKTSGFFRRLQLYAACHTKLKPSQEAGVQPEHTRASWEG